MTFKKEDWTDRLSGLEEVSQLILMHRETKERSHLALAICICGDLLNTP